MRIFYVLVFLVCVGFAAEAAVPQLQDFDTNQFGTAGGIVRIKSGANLTNPIVANGIAPTNANYLLFDFTNSIVPIGKVLVPGANVVFSPNATGIVLSVTAAGTNGFQDPGANGMVVRVATNTSVARQILGTADQIAVDNGTGVGGDPTIRLIGPWTNNAGVVQLTTPTNALEIPFYVQSTGLVAHTDGYAHEIGIAFPQDATVTVGVGYGITGVTNSVVRYEWGHQVFLNYGVTNNDLQSAGSVVLNFGIHTNDYTGLLGFTTFSTDFQGNFGIVGSTWAGNESPDHWAVPIEGFATAVEGFGTSAYKLNVGLDGIAYGDGAWTGQTNIGVFGAAIDTAGVNRSYVGVYGGVLALAKTPNFITAGGLFDAPTNSGSALVARKYDGSQVFDVSWNGITSTKFGRVIARFATATNYTLTVANHYLVSTATQTNTLPAANAVAAGQIFIIKNKSGTTTVRPAGADTIDGVAADDVFAAKVSNTYISDGVSNWEKN